MPEHGGITRRSLLAAGAAAAAAELARPYTALAALTKPSRPVLTERYLAALSPHGVTLELDGAADLLGVQWRSPERPSIQLRFRTGSGRWTRWVSATGCLQAHRERSLEGGEGGVGAPVWTGGATVVQLRSTPAASDVRLHAVDVSAGLGARRRALLEMPLAAGALAHAGPLLQAGPGQPPIIARHVWARGGCHPSVAPEYGAVKLAFVHHTENPNGYPPGEVPAMLRAIYAFHRYVNGWDDIGYNFVIDLYGRIWEARAGGIDEPVTGAQAGGYNLVSTGVAVLGTFMSVPISRAAQGALERLLAWKLSLHGVPASGHVEVSVNPAGASYSRYPANAHVSLPRVAGHRDGDSTDCPGNVLYGELKKIRARVSEMAGRVAVATLAASQPPSPQPTQEPQAPSGETVLLSGSLSYRAEPMPLPVAGAPILIQARSVADRGQIVHERTLAQLLTDANGDWSLSVSVTPAAKGGGVTLRVLCPGGAGLPVTVSEPLHLAGAVALTPAAPPASPQPSPQAVAPPAA